MMIMIDDAHCHVFVIDCVCVIPFAGIISPVVGVAFVSLYIQ